MTTTTIHSDTILDAVEVGLEGNPDIGEVEFESRRTGENKSVRMVHVRINGELYLVVAKKVGSV